MQDEGEVDDWVTTSPLKLSPPTTYARREFTPGRALTREEVRLQRRRDVAVAVAAADQARGGDTGPHAHSNVPVKGLFEDDVIPSRRVQAAPLQNSQGRGHPKDSSPDTHRSASDTSSRASTSITHLDTVDDARPATSSPKAPSPSIADANRTVKSGNAKTATTVPPGSAKRARPGIHAVLTDVAASNVKHSSTINEPPSSPFEQPQDLASQEKDDDEERVPITSTRLFHPCASSSASSERASNSQDTKGRPIASNSASPIDEPYTVALTLDERGERGSSPAQGDVDQVQTLKDEAEQQQQPLRKRKAPVANVDEPLQSTEPVERAHRHKQGANAGEPFPRRHKKVALEQLFSEDAPNAESLPRGGRTNEPAVDKRQTLCDLQDFVDWTWPVVQNCLRALGHHNAKTSISTALAEQIDKSLGQHLEQKVAKIRKLQALRAKRTKEADKGKRVQEERTALALKMNDEERLWQASRREYRVAIGMHEAAVRSSSSRYTGQKARQSAFEDLLQWLPTTEQQA